MVIISVILLCQIIVSMTTHLAVVLLTHFRIGFAIQSLLFDVVYVVVDGRSIPIIVLEGRIDLL